MHIKSFKAQGTDALKIPTLVISFDRECPATNTLVGQRGLFSGEAKSLVDALMKHLPGGLISHLTAELMHRQASLLVVPMGGITYKSEDVA